MPVFQFFRRDEMEKSKKVVLSNIGSIWAFILKNIIIPIQMVLSFGFGLVAFIVIFCMLIGVAPRVDPTMNLLTIWGLYSVFVGIYSIMVRGQIVRSEKKALIHSWTLFLASAAYGYTYYLHYFYVWLDQYEVKALYLINPSQISSILGAWWQHHVDNITNFSGLFGFVYNVLNNPLNITNITLTTESIILSFVFAFVVFGFAIAATAIAIVNVVYFNLNKKDYSL